jgi:hypothetical protein
VSLMALGVFGWRISDIFMTIFMEYHDTTQYDIMTPYHDTKIWPQNWYKNTHYQITNAQRNRNLRLLSLSCNYKVQINLSQRIKYEHEDPWNMPAQREHRTSTQRRL